MRDSCSLGDGDDATSACAYVCARVFTATFGARARRTLSPQSGQSIIHPLTNSPMNSPPLAHLAVGQYQPQTDVTTRQREAENLKGTQPGRMVLPL